MRHLIFTLSAALMISSPALAHPEKADPKPATDISDIQLPSKAEVEDMIDEMPDFNALMGAMMTIMKDEDLRDSLKDAGKSLSESVEKSGLTDMTADLDKGELPDINKLMATMLRLTADDNVMGKMLDVAKELEATVEENIDEDMLKPKGK